MDGKALINLVNSFLKPAREALIVLIPTACGVYCLVQALLWYSKDDNEKQQFALSKKIKQAIVVAVVAESITVILGIFGIASVN